MKYKIGSLFDGSGGFPLAGSLCGVEPVWASEVEPYPIAVTRSRFPGMKHLGSVTDIHGGEIEPVDIITFGSPCQDLSVAGKRAGLKHEANGDNETTRSGLFMEAVRIIKEMREATNGRYPRFALWENVPGAFSSNKGEDFRTVLGELIRIVDKDATMPSVPKSGWPYADSYCGDGWSLAYRVFDAQYWGVHQRRRRIHLVLDLRGGRAREVLFEREGVRGYFAQGREAWKGLALDAQGSAGAADREGEHGSTAVAYSFDSLASNSMKSSNPNSGCRKVEIAKTLDTTDPNPCKNQGGIAVVEAVPYTIKIRSGCEGGTQRKGATSDPQRGSAPDDREEAGCAVYDARGNGDGKTISTLTGDHNNRVTDYTSVVCMGNCQLNNISMSEQCNTLDCMHDQQAVLVFDKEVYNSGANAAGGHYIAEDGPAPALRTKHHPGVCIRYIVRRLTPTECARLQGFPDWWGHPDCKDSFTEEELAFWQGVRDVYAEINGKQVKAYTAQQMLKWYNGLHTDSAEYKMWGNGIALPPALYVMQGIVDALDRED